MSAHERKTNSAPPALARSTRRRLGGLALVLLGIVAATVWTHRRHIADELLRTEPAQILKTPALLREAMRIARPQYQRHCQSCHGSAFQGDAALGAPNLAGNVWLYGDDPVDVERTILYGIRSGHPKSRNLTDMPALVRMGQITADDARDAAEYLQSLAGRPYEKAAALRGRSIYYNEGNCFDCHANDAKGVTDYGAPALTGPIWIYGGDRESLYRSIVNGRHGKCPAWVNVLTPVQIRALALYLVAVPRLSAPQLNTGGPLGGARRIF
jgi:cytochrome c oxidase cbb3-type subunit 3